jgi:hypothetical protein
MMWYPTGGMGSTHDVVFDWGAGGTHDVVSDWGAGALMTWCPTGGGGHS